MHSTMAKKIRARREFADQIRFLKKDNQWSFDQAVKRASELRGFTETYFDTFTSSTDHQGTVNQMKKNLERVIKNVEDYMNSDCKPEGWNVTTGDKVNPTHLDIGIGHDKYLKKLLLKHAQITRDVLIGECPREANRLLKRIDRLRLRWHWQLCTKNIQPNSEFCTEELKSDTNPRETLKADESYGIKIPRRGQIFQRIQCSDDASTLVVCPFGGKVKILNAKWGRSSLDTCYKASETELCDPKGVTKKAKKSCNGKTSCDFELVAKNREDHCPGVRKYIEIEYTCRKIQN